MMPEHPLPGLPVWLRWYVAVPMAYLLMIVLGLTFTFEPAVITNVRLPTFLLDDDHDWGCSLYESGLARTFLIEGSIFFAFFQGSRSDTFSLNTDLGSGFLAFIFSSRSFRFCYGGAGPRGRCCIRSPVLEKKPSGGARSAIHLCGIGLIRGRSPLGSYAPC